LPNPLPEFNWARYGFKDDGSFRKSTMTSLDIGLFTGPVSTSTSLYLSAMPSPETLRQYNIGAVVNCQGNPGKRDEAYTSYDAVGLKKEMITQCNPGYHKDAKRIGETIRLINSWLRQGINVLIHCNGGRHRAACIACIWFMCSHGCSFHAAATVISNRRPVVELGEDFQAVIQEVHFALFGYNPAVGPAIDKFSEYVDLSHVTQLWS